MNLHIRPSSLNGVLAVPASKSHTIRALTVALMGDGVSHIRYPLDSGDTRAVLRAVQQLGAKLLFEDETLWTIQGCGGRLTPPQGPVLMDNSGTGLRLLCALTSLAAFPVTFDGDDSLRTRQMQPLLDALQACGVRVQSHDGHAPLTVCGPLCGTHINLSAPTSQFLSALLLALPCAEANSEIQLSLLNEKPYVELTLKYLREQDFIFDYADDFMHWHVSGNNVYKPVDITVPADFSTAAFPLIASLITQSPLTLLNLDFSDLQGDKAVFDYVRSTGFKFIQKGTQTCLQPPEELKPLTLDLNATPDALPALCTLAACTHGVTRLYNVPQARIKETDRIDCMCRELTKMGVECTELPDGIVIHGNPDTLHGASVQSHNDHRIAMALAVLGLRAAGETIVCNADAAAVTYPAFVRDFKSLGADFYIK